MNRVWIAVATVALLSIFGMSQTGAQASSSNAGTANVQSGGANAAMSSNTSLGSSTQTDKKDTSGQASAGAAGSTSVNGASANTSSSGSLAAGTTIPATLNKSIDARKAKTGDEVSAKTTQTIRASSGMEIPRGSRLVGHVTDAKAKAKGDSESSLGIAFDRAVLRNGQQIPFNASIRALAASANSASAGMNDDSLGASGTSSMGGDMSAPMAAPRAAGGVLGGAANTVGGVANTAGNTVGGAANGIGNTAANIGASAGSTVSGTTRGASGQLTSQSQGVIGLKGLSLSSAAENNTSGSVITSTGKDVKLDSGTQMLLQVNQQ